MGSVGSRLPLPTDTTRQMVDGECQIQANPAYKHHGTNGPSGVLDPGYSCPQTHHTPPSHRGLVTPEIAFRIPLLRLERIDQLILNAMKIKYPILDVMSEVSFSP